MSLGESVCSGPFFKAYLVQPAARPVRPAVYRRGLLRPRAWTPTSAALAAQRPADRPAGDAAAADAVPADRPGWGAAVDPARCHYRQPRRSRAARYPAEPLPYAPPPPGGPPPGPPALPPLGLAVHRRAPTPVTGVCAGTQVRSRAATQFPEEGSDDSVTAGSAWPSRLVLTLVGGIVRGPAADRGRSIAHTWSRYFANSNGIYAGDDVRILGVPVGKIDKIEPQPAPRQDHVLVRQQIQGARRRQSGDPVAVPGDVARHPADPRLHRRAGDGRTAR